MCEKLCYTKNSSLWRKIICTVNDPEIRYQTMLGILKERGCRLTSQRLMLLRLLAEAGAHPNALQLYERMLPQFPTISLATIYKNPDPPGGGGRDPGGGCGA